MTREKGKKTMQKQSEGIERTGESRVKYKKGFFRKKEQEDEPYGNQESRSDD